MNTQTDSTTRPTLMNRILNRVEVVGNKLPDPAILFLASLIIIWLLSWLLSGITFNETNPRTGEPLQVVNLLTGTQLASFLSNMVTTFTSFAPLGVVLVAMLGVGVADESKFINTGLKLLLNRTASFLLTPMVIFIGIISHSAVDAGYVLVIPLGGIIFYAAGRHPLAGIAAAFAGVSGGFSANPVPSALDPLLQGFTQPAAQIIDAAYQVNPLCNYFFTASSCLLIVLLGWFLTDKVLEPRLKKSAKLNDDIEPAEDLSNVTPQEKKPLSPPQSPCWSEPLPWYLHYCLLTRHCGRQRFAELVRRPDHEIHRTADFPVLPDPRCGVRLYGWPIQKDQRRDRRDE